MTQAHRLWAVGIGSSALLAIVSFYVEGAQILHWISKPLTTLLILMMTLRRGVAGTYRRWIVIGLLWSTLGDVFLMLPGDRFVPGLSSFLLAHLAYLAAFCTRSPWAARSGPYLVYALISGSVIVLLWSHIPSALKLPVAAYVLALSAMAAQAAVCWRVHRERATICAAAGGALFLFSDSVIAINRFAWPFESSKAVVLVSYWAAQWLIASSVPPVSRASAGTEGQYPPR